MKYMASYDLMETMRNTNQWLGATALAMASYPAFAVIPNPALNWMAAWGEVTERSFSRMVVKPDWDIPPAVGVDGADHPVLIEKELRHMGLVAVVAPLLAFGLGDRLRWLIISPLIATVLEFMVVWAWHLPQLHGMAYLLPAGFALEQGSFLIVGLLVWVSALRAHNGLAGAGSLLLTSMHMTLLGALLILAPRDVFAEICGRAADLGGQQLGGLLMLGIGTPVYLIAGLWLVGRDLRSTDPAPQT